MHPFTSIRRLALTAALAGAAFGAVPALASASSNCAYDPVTRIATVNDLSGSNQLRVMVRFGDILSVQDGGGVPVDCVGGGALGMTENTDHINVNANAAGASDGVILDASGGAFAPGVNAEEDKHPEVEITVNGNAGHLTMIGTPGADTFRVGGRHSLDMGIDDDTDVTFTASDVALLGGDGPDFLGGQGYGALGATALPLSIAGGADEDRLFGGNGLDHLAGNAGNDSLHSDDGAQDFVNGGPDFDNAFRDAVDVLSNVESPPQ